MRDSGSSGDKVFGRFTEPAHRVMDLAREEAERCGHRYLGPEHVLLGLLAEGHSAAAGVLAAHGVDLTAGRAGLLRLDERGMVPPPPAQRRRAAGVVGHRPGRCPAQQRTGLRCLGGRGGDLTVTRRRGWWSRRVVWTPLCGPPLVAKRALQLASEQAHALGHGQVSPEHLLLGVLEDARQPADTTHGSRRHRQIIAHVGLPDGYRGGAGLLLATLGVDLDRLHDAVAIELGGIRP
jgi:Clp amino terminal domain, pathogenicity island component